MDFFSGVRADQKDRYELISHIGRGACALPPRNARAARRPARNHRET